MGEGAPRGAHSKMILAGSTCAFLECTAAELFGLARPRTALASLRFLVFKPQAKGPSVKIVGEAGGEFLPSLGPPFGPATSRPRLGGVPVVRLAGQGEVEAAGRGVYIEHVGVVQGAGARVAIEGSNGHFQGGPH